MFRIREFSFTFFVIAFSLFSASVLAMESKSLEIEGLQILIDPNADWFTFKAYVDGNIIYDLITPRPAGSTFKEKCLVFPQNTINVKEQQSFLHDRQGNFLTKEASIGLWKCAGKALVQTSLAQIPPVGTCFEESTWTFIFNECSSKKVIATGRHTIVNELMPGKKLIKNELVMVEEHNSEPVKVCGKAYVAPDGNSFVIEVTFGKKIIINFS
jgi:hypothetical protein